MAGAGRVIGLARQVGTLILLAVATVGLWGTSSAAAGDKPRVLLFSHTTGFRHASIEAGIEAIERLAAREKITVVASEDPAVFSSDGLSDFDAIIFLSSTTDPKRPESEWLQGARRDALQAFVRRGGGIVGIHAAADSHYHWPWYGQLIGGRFARHPAGTPEGMLRVVERKHHATKGVDATMRRVDEWYYFDDYNPEAQLLVTLDPASIGQADVNPNPISWVHEFEGGRVFYTAMGHTAETYSDRNFLNHLAGGLRWVMKR